MRYFVKIGAIRGNQSGVGARGWAIFQDDNTYSIEYGGIEMVVDRQGRQPEFYWRDGYPTEQTFVCGSPDEASDDVEERIIKKLNGADRSGDARYSELPHGVEILPTRY